MKRTNLLANRTIAAQNRIEHCDEEIVNSSKSCRYGRLAASFSVAWLLAVGSASPAFGQSAGAARISGVIEADDGSEVANAAIRIAKMPEYELRGGRFVRSGPFVGRTLEWNGDAYSFADLPDGQYQICVFARGFLDTCRWPGRSFFEVGPETRNVEKRVRLQKGSIVQIVVEDPGRLMQAPDELLRGSEIKVGAQAPDGAVHLANVVAREDGRLVTEVTVPFDTPMKLWVHSNVLEIESKDVAELSTRGPNATFEARRSEPLKKLVLRVTGRRPVLPDPPRLPRIPPRPPAPDLPSLEAAR